MLIIKCCPWSSVYYKDNSKFKYSVTQKQCRKRTQTVLPIHWMTAACPVTLQSHNQSGTVASSYCFKWRILFPISPQLSVFVTQQQEFPKHPLISVCKFQQVCKYSLFYWCCSSTQQKSLLFKRSKNIHKKQRTIICQCPNITLFHFQHESQSEMASL